MIFKPNLLTVAGFLVFGSYGVKDRDDVRRAVCKISCACNWRLMDVHGVRVLKDGEAVEIIKRKNINVFILLCSAVIGLVISLISLVPQRVPGDIAASSETTNKDVTSIISHSVRKRLIFCQNTYLLCVRSTTIKSFSKSTTTA